MREVGSGRRKACEKWLKQREGRVVGCEQLGHFKRIAAAIDSTITLMEGIDSVVDEYAGWPFA